MLTRPPSPIAGIPGLDPDTILQRFPAAMTIEDRAGRVVYANAMAAELLGFRSVGELLSAPTEELVGRFDVRDEAGHPLSIERFPGRQALRGEDPDELLVRVRLGGVGPGRWRLVSAIPLPDETGDVAFAVNVFRDVTSAVHSHQRLTAQYEVVRVLADAETLPEAAPRIISAVCRSLEWDLGLMWRVDESAGVLRFVAAWHDPSVRVQRFLEMSESRSFEPGVGLPGRVWTACEPVWTPDLQVEENAPRAIAASRDGLHAAFGLPVVRGGEVVGVIEFLSREIREPDEDVLQMVTAVGAQVGQFVVRQRAEEEQRLLVEATDALSGSLDFEDTLKRVADLAVPQLADLCIVYLAEEDGSIRRVAVREGDRIQRALPVEVLDDLPLDPDAAEGVPAVLRSGSSAFHPVADARLLAADVHDRDRLESLLKRVQVRSWMCVPLSARGRTFGAASFVSADSGRRFQPDDLALAEELGRRAALAVDNARLFGEAEEARDRLAYLAEVSRSLSASLNYRRTLAKVARLTVPRLADWCLVDVLEDDGSLRLLAVSHADPEKVRLARRLRRRYPPDPDGDVGVSKVVRTGKPELVSTVTHQVLRAAARDEEHLRLVRDLGLRSAMIVPLAARGRVLGAVTMVAAESGRRYGPRELRLAEEVAARAAVAMDNARLYEDRASVARTLQQSLLPPDLPQLPGVELAATYHPAEAGEIGGDFYDVFAVTENEWAIVIGDVCGKGVEAASVTGMARHTIRATAIRGMEPAEVIAGLNDVMRRDEPDAGFCTVAYGRLRVRRGGASLSVACGGHPPPLVVRAEGTVEPTGPPSPLVGVLPKIDVRQQTVSLRPGDAVVLYTDGVTDRRVDGEYFGEERLAEVLAGASGLGARGVLQCIEESLEEFASEPPRDDIALLVVRLLPGEGPGSPPAAAGK